MIAERFSRILVPTDMSIFARLALRWARLFHTHLGSRVTLLHAHEAFYPLLGSTHRRFRDEAVVGSTTGRVVRYARLPVLTIVPTPAVTEEEKREEELAFA